MRTVLMHDCAHASFLPSRRAERLIGRVLGVLVFTPYTEWQHTHLVHHATSGDLDRRGTGDIWTCTVDEYRAASAGKRLMYRLTRNPAVVLLLGPLFLFGWDYRVPNRGIRGKRLRSVLLTDLAVAAIVTAGCLALGPWTYLLVQGPVLLVAGAFGIALFYVQHQFDRSYRSRSAGWEPSGAVLHGSSVVRLPRVLQWFSGSSARCALWDEAAGRYVSFGEFRALAAPPGEFLHPRMNRTRPLLFAPHPSGSELRAGSEMGSGRTAGRRARTPRQPWRGTARACRRAVAHRRAPPRWRSARAPEHPSEPHVAHPLSVECAMLLT